MKSSRLKKATGVLMAAFALAASGCGSGSKDEGKTIDAGNGTRQITTNTTGEGTGATAGGTTGGEGSTGGGGLSPALIMTIVN